MLSIGINNLFVLSVYCISGLLVSSVTRSKLAPVAPWGVFSVHMVQTIVIFISHTHWMGLLPCLALVLPHAWLEIPGLVLGCIAGVKLYRGQRPFTLIAVAAMLIIIAAYVETYITPFPLGHWLN